MRVTYFPYGSVSFKHFDFPASAVSEETLDINNLSVMQAGLWLCCFSRNYNS